MASPATRIAGRAATPVTALWDRLAQATTPRAELIDPSVVEGLPEPARRWLLHSVAPGTPLRRPITLHMRGHLRVAGWLPFRAVQVHSPPDGYVWAARVGLGPLSISGFDRYECGAGEMRWRLLGRLPVVTATGPDLDRSAAGRVALDAVFVPAAWLGPHVTWREAGTDDSAIGEWTIGGYLSRCRITVDRHGAPLSVSMPRWARPKGLPWGEYPCGGILSGERDFGGIQQQDRRGHGQGEAAGQR